MAKLDLSQAEFLFHCDALADAGLLVHQFSGRESLSQPFEFQIDLVCDDPDLDLEAPIGQPACLTLHGRLFDGSRYSRHIHGVIERLIQVGAGLRQSRYQATLVPTIKTLAFTRNSRIFQKQSGPDVTQKVLKDDKVPGDWVSTLLHGTYGARDYCVQYQESDLDFVQRLWEEEGIFYFFEHEADKDKLVLGDGGHAFPELSEYGEAQLRDTPHLHEECLFEFRSESALRPGATVLRDFKFKQPTLDMEATAQSDKFADYKMYFFPGEYVDPALGKQYAKLRLEELQCQKNRYVGAGSVRAMLPGHKFTLSGHRRSDCNQEYLIVSVEHRGTQPQALAEEGATKQEPSYQNRIACIPAKVPFRPARETPRPTIAGVQTAAVVGPPGEEIHCDDHGRVKVKFHWDRDPGRDDNSSCWIRVSQPWGGAGQGGMFIPRIGQEVVVQFLEGDPDRPLIVGRVYNGENPVPHGLPAGKNISTIRSSSTPGGAGFNEIKFNDSAGSEEMFIHAQHDRNEIVGNNHDTKVAVDQALQVGSNQNTSVGADQSLSVGANQSNTIGADQSTTVGANHSLSVTADQDISVGGDQTIDVTGNQTTTVTGAATTTVVSANTLTSLAGYTITVIPDLSVTVAAKTSVESGASVSTMAPIVKTQAVSVSTEAVLVSTDGVLVSTQAAIISVEGGLIGIKGGTINMEGGTVNVSGGTINVSGGTVTVAGGGGAMTIDGGGVDISGSAVKISGGTVDIKGGVVSIN